MLRFSVLLTALLCASFVLPNLASAAPTKAEMQARMRAIEDAKVVKVQGLLEHLTSDDMAVREKAAKGLTKLSRRAFKATPLLIEALKDGDEFTRVAVAKALAKIGRKAALAAPNLAALIKDGSGKSVV